MSLPSSLSCVFYKFKSAKDSDYDLYTFDGNGTSVFDLKKEIITAKKLGKGTDFDLAIYNAQTDEEYVDDAFTIPKNTSVIVRRLPASKPGKGTAQRYVNGMAPVGASGSAGRAARGGDRAERSEFGTDGERDGAGRGSRGYERSGFGGDRGGFGRGHARSMTFINAPPRQNSSNSLNSHASSFSDSNSITGVINTNSDSENPIPTDDSEEARIQAMFQQSSEQWAQEQRRMAEQAYIPQMGPGWRGRGRGRGTGSDRGGTPDARGGFHGAGGGAGRGREDIPERIPPPNYVCFRCGQKGHYINNCPTNGDKEFDKHPRIKRTTGIPRSFLKVVEEPKGAVTSGGVMVTPRGDLVVAQADSSTWDKLMAKSATTLNFGASSASDLWDLYNSVPVRPDLECPICKGLFREAVVIPCCGTTYCDECIRKWLLEKDFTCESCGTPERDLDGLVPNMDVRESVEAYLREFARSRIIVSLQGKQGESREGSEQPQEVGEREGEKAIEVKGDAENSNSNRQLTPVPENGKRQPSAEPIRAPSIEAAGDDSINSKPTNASASTNAGASTSTGTGTSVSTSTSTSPSTSPSTSVNQGPRPVPVASNSASSNASSSAPNGKPHAPRRPSPLPPRPNNNMSFNNNNSMLNPSFGFSPAPLQQPDPSFYDDNGDPAFFPPEAPSFNPGWGAGPMFPGDMMSMPNPMAGPMTNPMLGMMGMPPNPMMMGGMPGIMSMGMNGPGAGMPPRGPAFDSGFDGGVYGHDGFGMPGPGGFGVGGGFGPQGGFFPNGPGAGGMGGMGMGMMGNGMGNGMNGMNGMGNGMNGMNGMGNGMNGMGNGMNGMGNGMNGMGMGNGMGNGMNGMGNGMGNRMGNGMGNGMGVGMQNGGARFGRGGGIGMGRGDRDGGRDRDRAAQKRPLDVVDVHVTQQKSRSDKSRRID